MSVLVQRLKDEYGAEVCVTAPTVPYKGESGRSCSDTKQ